jgi:hypothetical protein
MVNNGLLAQAQSEPIRAEQLHVAMIEGVGTGRNSRLAPLERAPSSLILF